MSNFDSLPGRAGGLPFLFTGDKQSDNTSKQNQQRISIYILQPRSLAPPVVEMSPLVRWRAEERPRLLIQLPHTDMRAFCSLDSFPKVGDPIMRAFLDRWLASEKRIGGLVDNLGMYSLIIPKTAGYYIAAFEQEMERTQQMRIGFGSQKMCDLAMVLLNSNCFFWFWRVFGDAFHVTRGNVEACPVPEYFDESYMEIAEKLRRNIEDCTVYKGYRGKDVPNVNFNLRMDLLCSADQWIIHHVAPDLGLSSADFVWAKSNSFMHLCVPKSSAWPADLHPVSYSTDLIGVDRDDS
jgi:hypothetical protein